MKKKLALAAVSAALLTAATDTPAYATVDQHGSAMVTVWAGPSAKCRAYTVNIDPYTFNSDIKGVFESYNGGLCQAWLERKRYNADGSVNYDWTKVSHTYTWGSGTVQTGWHWNGTDAGSRVCVIWLDTNEKGCSKGIW
ncbi:hypothetical protein [Streptomyces sp. NPDC058486]|uniref:hypothetical protein n=1 Tax=unclassified Streptomyces TaxID=2593676 RepID=UPI00364E2A8C